MLETVGDVSWYPLEVLAFVPIDLLTVHARDTLIPRCVKEAMPFLSCRRYDGYTPPRCGPAHKYRHTGLFKATVCGHYDPGSGNCTHPKLRT
jgi:hypothetical protein